MATPPPTPPTPPGSGTPDCSEGSPAPVPATPGDPIHNGAPTAASEEPAPPPGPTAWHALADDRLPGFWGLPPKHRALYAAVAAAVIVGGILFGYYANFGLDQATSTDRARADKNAEKAVDREQPAFVSTITPPDYEQEGFDPIIFVLDRPLTAGEQATLTSLKGGQPKEVWAFMKSLGGRIVQYPRSFKPLAGGHQSPRGIHAQTFNLNLNSDRDAGLTINSMTAVKDTCTAPTARTVVNIPPAGSNVRPGLLWDMPGGLADKPEGPYALDEGDDQGQLYFRHNAIDLGNGQSNMALRIQSLVTDQTCKWHINASYTDTTGQHDQRIPAGAATFTTEAVPSNPVQYFENVISEGWGCIGEMSQQGCTATKTLERVRPGKGN